MRDSRRCYAMAAGVGNILMTRSNRTRATTPSPKSPDHQKPNCPKSQPQGKQKNQLSKPGKAQSPPTSPPWRSQRSGAAGCARNLAVNQGGSEFRKKGGWGYFGFLVLGTWGLGLSGFGLVDKAVEFQMVAAEVASCLASCSHLCTGDVDKQVAQLISQRSLPAISQGVAIKRIVFKRLPVVVTRSLAGHTLESDDINQCLAAFSYASALWFRSFLRLLWFDC